MDCSVGDLLILERPTAAQLAWEADPSNGSGDKPDDAPELLRRLSSAVGGLDGPLAVIVRRGAGEHAVEPANSPHLPPLRCGTCCLDKTTPQLDSDRPDSDSLIARLLESCRSQRSPRASTQQP